MMIHWWKPDMNLVREDIRQRVAAGMIPDLGL